MKKPFLVMLLPSVTAFEHDLSAVIEPQLRCTVSAGGNIGLGFAIAIEDVLDAIK